jgi:hypothetical protein
VSDKDPILNNDTFANKSVTRNLAAFAYAGILLDFYECADLCFISDLASVQIDEVR